MALKGRRVTVVEAGSPTVGVVRGVGVDGALLLETEAGTVRVMAGDVTVEGAYEERGASFHMPCFRRRCG